MGVKSNIEIDMYGEMIRGVLHIPKQSKEIARVYIMCYGYNGDMCEVNRLTRNIGIASEMRGCYFVRFDYRGQGISDGNCSDISFKSKVEDVKAIMDFINGCFGNDLCDFYLIGFSDGGKVALEVAKSKKIKKLILWNPILNMSSISHLYSRKHETARKIYRDVLSEKRLASLFGLGISISYLNEIMKINLENELLMTTKNILCIWGEQDNYTKSLREKVINLQVNNIKNIVIPDAEHLFGKIEQQKELVRYTLDGEE